MAIERMQLSSPTLLRELMKANKLTQKRLSELVGCNQSFIAFLVTGRRARVKRPLATRLAETLGVQLDRLFVPIVSPNTRQRPSRTSRTIADDDRDTEAAA